MAPPSAWFDSQIAHTPEDLQNGDGCHLDEVQALRDYLGDFITKEKAALRITQPILNESKPADETYRLWGLLCDALIDLDEEDRLKSLDLLAQIRKLASHPNIDWSDLPGLASMWVTQYGGHWTGSDPPGIRMAIASSDEAMVKEFEQRFAVIGRTEAEMLVRGFKFPTCDYLGFKVLSLALSNKVGLEIYMNQIFGWLDTAGERLREAAMSEDGLTERWSRYKHALLELSQEGSRFSDEGRKLAKRFYDLM